MVPHSRPCLGRAEEEAAARAVRSGHPAQGPEVAALEAALAERIGVPHAVAVSSGTAALALCLTALGTGHGHEVVFPSYVCTALLHAARQAGAAPILVDIAPPGFNLSADAVRSAVTAATKAVIVPHAFGCVAPLPPLPTGVGLIEDCAMALGATIGGKPAGASGVAGVFSFYATKVICAGEGGAVATADAALAGEVRDRRDYDGRSDARPRFNWKLTDLQAAVARVQLSRLPDFLARRRDLGARYSAALAGTSAVLPRFGPGDFPYRYIVRHARSAGDLIRGFEREGVAARRPVFAPLHEVLALPDATFPATTEAHRHAVSLPLYPDLCEDEAARVMDAARKLL